MGGSAESEVCAECQTGESDETGPIKFIEKLRGSFHAECAIGPLAEYEFNNDHRFEQQGVSGYGLFD